MQKTRLNEATILVAATQIADEDGLHGLIFSKLARKLGVRPPSLYNHVNGLRGLKIKLSVYGLTLLDDCFIKASTGQAKDDAVRALAEAYVDFARIHPGLYEAIQRIPDGKDKDIQKAGGRVIDTVIQVFRAYNIDNDELPIHLARCFRSLFHGFVSIEQHGGFEMSLPVEEDSNINEIVNTLLEGIKIHPYFSRKG